LKRALRARMTKITEGEASKLGATADLADIAAVSDAREKLGTLEDEYAKLLSEVKSLKGKTNPRSKWELADAIARFLGRTKVKGIELEAHLKTLTRDTGISRTEMKYLTKFRKTYALREVDDDVLWSTYRTNLYRQPYGKGPPSS
jgi:hypothetical protein